MEKPSPQMAYLSELWKESSPVPITFSDPCPCCGNRKRRCPPSPSPSRKKLLVIDQPSPSPSTVNADTSSSPMTSPHSLMSPASSICRISNFIARRMQPAFQDSGSFSHRHSIPTSPPAVISQSAVIAPVAVTAPSAAIKDSGNFNRWRFISTFPAVKKPAAVIAPVKVKEPAAVIAPAKVKEPAGVITPEAVIVPADTCDSAGGERSNSSVSSMVKLVECSAEKDKSGRVGRGEGEFRVGLKCKCGTVREFVLTR